MTDLTQFLGDFKADEVPADEYALINPGTYIAIILDTELKNNQNTGSAGLSMQLQILGSQFNDRLIRDYINIKNKSEHAVNIGKRRLADYVLATGGTHTDISSFIGKRVSIEIGVQQPKEGATYTDKYGVEKPSTPQNNIKKVSGITGAAPVAAKPKPAPTPAQDDIFQPTAAAAQEPQAEGGKLPWEEDDEIPIF